MWKELWGEFCSGPCCSIKECAGTIGPREKEKISDE